MTNSSGSNRCEAVESVIEALFSELLKLFSMAIICVAGRAVFRLVHHASMNDIFAGGNRKAVADLIRKVGSVEECYLLGFVDDENDIVEPTFAGLHYLLFAAKMKEANKTHAEAFAAGYDCAQEEVSSWTLQIDALDLSE